MAYISFSFTNTQGDQSFQYDDVLDPANNPHNVGPLNEGDASGPLQCWQGDNGKGRIGLNGSVGGNLMKDIEGDGFSFDY